MSLSPSLSPPPSLSRYLYLSVPFVYPSVWMAHKSASQPKKFKVSPRFAVDFCWFFHFPPFIFCVFHVSRCARISAKYLPGSRANNDIPHSFCDCGMFACRGCRCCGKCKWCHWSRWGVDDVSTAAEVVALAFHAGKRSTSWTVEQLDSWTVAQLHSWTVAWLHVQYFTEQQQMGWTYTCSVCVQCTCMYIHWLPEPQTSWGRGAALKAKPKRCDKCQRATNDEEGTSQRTAVGDRQPTTTDNWQPTSSSSSGNNQPRTNNWHSLESKKCRYEMVECALNSYGIRMGSCWCCFCCCCCSHRNPHAALSGFVPWRGMRYKTPVSRQHASKLRELRQNWMLKARDEVEDEILSKAERVDRLWLHLILHLLYLKRCCDMAYQIVFL